MYIFPLFSNTQFELQNLSGTFSFDTQKLSFPFFQYYYPVEYSQIYYNNELNAYFQSIFLSNYVTQVQIYR